MAVPLFDGLRARFANWILRGTTMSHNNINRKPKSLVALARMYYDGDHVIYLTDRQRTFIDLHSGSVDLKFIFNHCATVVDALVERLAVTAIKVEIENVNNEIIEKIIWGWWEKNRLNAMQTETHRTAIVDGESFILTAWNNDKERPEYFLHPAFVSKDGGGDNYGMWMVYENDDIFREPEYAVKQWSIIVGNEEVVRRTFYYPNRIEKYFLDKKDGWVPFRGDAEIETDDNGNFILDDNGDPVLIWPIPWVLSDGTPIGIPVAHFKNPRRTTELKKLITVQDALNKCWLDIIAAADATGFRMLVILGFIPTSDGKEPEADGSNLLIMTPGQVLSTQKKPQDVSVSAIAPASIASLLDLEERTVFRIATLSGTPISRFSAGGGALLPRAETIRALEGTLIGRVEERQTLFGDGWEDLMRVSISMGVVFGGLLIEDTDLILKTMWRSPYVADVDRELKRAEQKAALGFIPMKLILEELGLSPQEVLDVIESEEYKAAIVRLTTSNTKPVISPVSSAIESDVVKEL